MQAISSPVVAHLSGQIIDTKNKDFKYKCSYCFYREMNAMSGVVCNVCGLQRGMESHFISNVHNWEERDFFIAN